MEVGSAFFYVEANIVCIIIFATLLIKDLGGVGRQTKQMIFVNIIISHILYFLSDIWWDLVLTGCIPAVFSIIAIFNIINAVLLSAITGFWFVYVELSQGEEYIKSLKARIIVLIPAMCETVIMLILFAFFPGVVVDGNLNLTTVYYVIFVGVPVMYVILSAVRSFIRAFRKENYAVRKQYVVCAVYPLFITVIGIIQTIGASLLGVSVPLFCFGCAVMMLYVYIISLNDQISIDELTRLNNRTQLKKYIVGEAAKPGNDVHFVLMIDLNKFKQINDQYGHVEGDHALRRAADALRYACSDNDMRPFIARYGGDEFIIIIRTDDEKPVKELCALIKSTLIRLNEESGAAYELTASIGYASYNGDIYAFQTALTKADEALYRDKKAAV